MINNVDVKRVFEKIKETYCYSLDDLLVKDKHFHISEARQVTMYLLHEKCGLSITDICRLLERCHNSVIYGVDSITWRLKYDKKFQERYKRMGYES